MTLINLLISVPAILIFILAVVFGIFRKTISSAVKLGTVLVAFFLSIPIASGLSKAIGAPLKALVLPLLAQVGLSEQTLATMPTLEALPEALAYSIATPFVFTVCFILLSLFLLIAYAVLKKVLKPLCEKQTGAQHRVFGALISVVIALVLIVGIYTPVVGLADTVASLELTEADLEGIGGADAILTAKEYADEINASPLFVGTRTLGGNWLYGTLSKTELNGDKVVLKNELSHLLDAALSATAFKGVQLEALGDKQVEALYSIEAAATDSKILMGILPELLSGASNAWLEGEGFLGIQKPAVNETVSGAFDTLLKIFSTSSRDNIEDDLHTLVSLADAVIDSGMLAKIGNTEELMLLMQKDGVISSIAAPLYDNPRMTPLVPEIINIGLRAAVKAMNIPETKEELHSQFTADLADELNAMSELSESEMTEALTGKMDEVCAEYVIELSDTEKYCLAVGIVYEFNGRNDISGQEIADFFNEYTAYSENDGEEIVTQRVRGASVTFISYDEKKSDEPEEKLLITFKNTDNVGEFVTMDASKNEQGFVTLTKDANKKSGAAYAAALMKLMKKQANAVAEGKAEDEEVKLKIMELTLDMAGSAEDSERISQSLNAKFEKDVENGVEIQPKLASKPENFPTAIPVITDILFTNDFTPAVDGNDKDKDEEQQKAASEASAKAVEKIAKAVSTLSTVIVNNTSFTENIAVIMQQTGAILDGITELSQNGQEKASLLTKSILSSDLVADRIPVSKDKLIGMAEVISNEVIKAKEEAKKEQEKPDENKPNEGKEDGKPDVTAAPVTAAPVTAAPVTAAPVTAAPVTTVPVTAAPVTAAPVTTAPVTTAPVTTAPVTTAPITTAAPETEAPGYENLFGATGEMLVNIMILTGDGSSEEKFEAIEAMMDNITPTSAKALLYVCSADLLMEYGISEEYAEGLAQGLSVLFSSLSEEVKPEDRTAVRSLFSLVFINKGAPNLFAGEGDSTLDISAYAFVKTVISSRAVCNAVKYISIDLSNRKLSEFDAGSLKIAFEKNYEQATKKYQKDAIDDLSDIFGVGYHVNQFDW